MKDIKDYLHFYLGCECRVIKDNETYVTGRLITVSEGGCVVTGSDNEKYYRTKLIQLGLRHLSDMTEEESISLGYARPSDWLFDHNEFGIHSSDTFLFLLKQGFDLFGLIDSGLAYDKTKGRQTNNKI